MENEKAVLQDIIQKGFDEAYNVDSCSSEEFKKIMENLGPAIRNQNEADKIWNENEIKTEEIKVEKLKTELERERLNHEKRVFEAEQKSKSTDQKIELIKAGAALLGTGASIAGLIIWANFTGQTLRLEYVENGVVGKQLGRLASMMNPFKKIA